jgi:hypothetical protein
MRKFRRADLGKFQFPLRQLAQDSIGHRRRNVPGAVIHEFGNLWHEGNL